MPKNMETNQKLITLETKALLSTLWIFVLLNMIFRDIHEIVTPRFLTEAMSGTYGAQVTDELLLVGGIMVEIVIIMVILTRVLAYRANRWVNVIIGAVTIALIIYNGVTMGMDLDDMFFAAVQIVALAFVIWTAWNWPRQDVLVNA